MLQRASSSYDFDTRGKLVQCLPSYAIFFVIKLNLRKKSSLAFLRSLFSYFFSLRDEKFARDGKRERNNGIEEGNSSC